MNDQARQTCKNLEYAIAIATRPGQIEYYRPSEDAKRIVENGELKALTHKIARLQREIDQVGLRAQLKWRKQHSNVQSVRAARRRHPAAPPRDGVGCTREGGGVSALTTRLHQYRCEVGVVGSDLQRSVSIMG